MSTTFEEPPPILSVRHRVNAGEWFIYNSFTEQPVAGVFHTKEAADAALAARSVRRRP